MNDKTPKISEPAPTIPAGPAIRVGVGAIIFKDEKVLLIRRGKEPFKGQWSIPGGKLEYGEALEAAVHREVLEETSVRIKDLHLFNIYEALPGNEAGKTGTAHHLMIDYCAHWEAGSPKAGDDAVDAGFFDADTALSLVAWDTTRTAIKDAYLWHASQPSCGQT